jgi:hypothetical protein
MDSSADYGGGGATIPTKDVSTAGFPQFPGDATILAHAAVLRNTKMLCKRSACCAWFAWRVAQGLLPDAAACIIDVPLASHPEL